jgi:hypothetical protein
MANLYYTNAGGDRQWTTLVNWNTAADGSGDTPTEAPWSGDTGGQTDQYDLVDASGGAGVLYSGNQDPFDLFYRTCFIPNVTFNSNLNYGRVWAGTNLTNNSTINSGKFEITGFTNNGTINYSAITITSGGSPFTGVWQGQLWSNGSWVREFRSVYYNAAVDQAWDTLGNWWNDSAFTDPALSLPADGNDVYITQILGTNPSAPITLNHIYVGNAEETSIYANLTNTTGDVTVNAGGDLTGEVHGNVIQNNNSANTYAVVYGDCVFYGNSYLFGYGTVNGTATFYGTSYNHGTVNNAVFYDSSYNEPFGPGGIISGNATFHNLSRNTGTINGDATVYYDGGDGQKPIGGTVGGTVTYIGFPQTPTDTLYYNDAQEDGDWGNLLNWWQDSGFTIQATALPTSTNPINLYNQVTQNTQGADQCFCSSANFWSANFGAGLTLQATGVVNMQGTSLLAGTTTDGVSMHDSSQLTDTSVIDGNVVMRDSSRAFGSILGNATIYYDGGNGQYPIGGTVGGTVTYLGWPAVSPQWFNDQVTGGADDGDFSNLANWWTDNNYNVRPINAEGTQEIPDASTDVFIAPNTGIVANSGTANPTINSVTANNSNIQNISITATNGFLFSGNEGVANAVLYGNVVFQDTAYNDHAVIQGKATYKSAASLQYSWGQNSLGNVNAGMYNGSTAFEVDIAGGGGGNGGFISRLLNFPWFIKF